MGQPHPRCYEPDAARFGRIALGIPYVEFDVPAGTAQGDLRLLSRDHGHAGEPCETATARLPP